MKYALLLALSLFVMSCEQEQPGIVCGREWNSSARIVADTTSTFNLADPMVIQYRHGTGFDFATLTTALYEGTLENKGKELWHKDTDVTSKMSDYTLYGKSSKGGIMTAKELTRQRKEGSIVVEFRTGDKVLSAREIKLTK